MKRILLLFTVLPLLICSCDKNNDDMDEWPEWHQTNDNHLIVGAWTLDSMEIVACESDNQTAVGLIYDQYKPQIGVVLGFSESGYYTESGSFHEIASKYMLENNQLYFSKDNMAKITFNENTFYFESDYTSGFQWFLEQPFMAAHKGASINKVIIKEVYKKVIHGD
ncbi:MAG: hypothetical protein LBV72_05455 [Tannerella sp.]|jgi:hypothetical protein|nr:hypothetical protein [Tannerella sp.]